MRISGGSGALRVGYHEAARLASWAVESRPPDVCDVTAQVVEVSTFWVTQKPLDLVLRVGTTEWLWPDVNVGAVTVGDESLTLTVRGFPRVSQPARRA